MFRDESAHMAFAFEVIHTVRREQPHLFDSAWAHPDDVLAGGVGLSRGEMQQYLEYVADQRLRALQLPIRYDARNPFAFMNLQDVQELTNFFERRVSAYQVGVQGEVAFDEAF